MSKESALEFLKKVKEDESFRMKLKESDQKDQSSAFVREQGFDFDKEELDQAKAEMGQDMTEDELSLIAGGGGEGGDCEGYGCKPSCYNRWH